MLVELSCWCWFSVVRVVFRVVSVIRMKSMDIIVKLCDGGICIFMVFMVGC